MRLLFITLLMILIHGACEANERLELIRAGHAEFIKINGREVHELKDDVQFRQGDAFLYCERALFDIEYDRINLYENVRIYDGKHRLFGDRVIYEGPLKIEKAFGHVRLEQDGQLLLADSVIYKQESRLAHAIGNVRITDLIEKATLTGQDIKYDRIAGYGIALGSPKIIQQDTSSQDSMIISGNKMEIWGDDKLAIITDSVKIVKGDITSSCMFAKFYSVQEKLFLFGSPKMVEQNRYIQGDSMEIQLDASDFKSGIIRGNATILSIDSTFEDILKGTKITMHTETDSNRTVIVERQAENVYHVFNDEDEMEGVNDIDGDRILMKFTGKKLTYVRVESTPGESRGKFTPANMNKPATE
ncbi:OstA-like protein [bacterium]